MNRRRHPYNATCTDHYAAMCFSAALSLGSAAWPSHRWCSICQHTMYCHRLSASWSMCAGMSYFR